MKRAIGLFALAMIPWSIAAGQEAAKKPVSAARLELTTEVAATTEDGYPSVLRVMLKNVGSVVVEMPKPEVPCVPEGGGIGIRYHWHSDEPGNHPRIEFGGWGCGTDDLPTLEERVKYDWIRLQPGEFVVLSDNMRYHVQNISQGTIEYWAEYTPPEITAQEFAELTNSGHVIPTEKLESEHKSFHVQ